MGGFTETSLGIHSKFSKDLENNLVDGNSHTRRDEGLKLCIHNLIQTIKHISWCKFWSATLCRNCGILVISRGSL